MKHLSSILAFALVAGASFPCCGAQAKDWKVSNPRDWRASQGAGQRSGQIGSQIGAHLETQDRLQHLGGFPAPGQQADRVPLNQDLARTTSLPGHVAGWVTPANRLGPVPDSVELNLTFVLRRAPEVQAAFEQLLADQQNPASTHFHQWLTPQEVGLLFGPTQNDIAAFSSWLTARGIRVGELSFSRILLQAAAPASIVAAAFSTSFNYYTMEGGPHLSVATEPILPAAFGVLVGSIEGVNDVPLHPMHQRSIVPVPAAAGVHPQYTSVIGKHYISPGDFAILYDLNPSLQAGYNGAGQRVAILGRSRVMASDITGFQANVGLHASLPNAIVPPNGSDPGLTGDGNQDEATLDVDRVLGTAPGAQADLVIASSASGGISTAAQYAVNTLNDPIMTISFGACERAAGAANVNLWDNLFATAAAQGISVFVASGDSSAAACDAAFVAPPANQALNINYICASSYATCVGGTEFADFSDPTAYWTSTNSPGRVSARSYIPEGAWNDPVSTDRFTGATSYVVQGGGGGQSMYVRKPSWQTGVGVPADGSRDVPDVSFASSGHEGYYACLAYAGADCNAFFISFAGTSAAAPAMAGITAMLDERIGKPQGNLNPLLYRLAATPGNNVFHDATPATSGVASCLLSVPSMCNNSTAGLTGGVGTLSGGLSGYVLTAGYDLATGWGSLDVGAFLTGAAGQIQLIATTGTLQASPASIKTNQTVTLTATFTANNSSTPTGTVQFSSNGTALGAPVTLVNGVATSPPFAFAAVGTYSIGAAYSGDATFSPAATPTLLLVVTAAGASLANANLTATPPAATTAQAVVFTTTVTGGGGTPTGTVQFVLDGVLSGTLVPLVNGIASSNAAPLAVGTHTAGASYSGDNTFAPATSNSITVVVTQSIVPSITSITVNPTTINVGGSSQVGAKVSGVVGSPVPTGTVTLKYGTTKYVSLPISNGSVIGRLGGLVAGTYPLFMVYSGDSVYAPSTSGVTNLIVVGGSVPSTTSITVNPSSITTAGTSQVGAMVTGVSGGPVPTGTATLRYGTTTVGTVLLDNGSASAGLRGLLVGTYPLFMTYSGDGVYASSVSGVTNLIVTSGAPAAYSFVVLNPTLIVTAGASLRNTNTLNVSSSTGYAGSFAISCTVAANGGPVSDAMLPVCTPNPATLTLSSGVTLASSTLTITTIAANLTSSVRVAGLRIFGGSAFCGLLLFWLPGFRRRRILASLICLLLSTMLVAMSGCGSGGIVPSPFAGTAIGAYTVTVVGQTGNPPAATTQFTLNVQ